MNQTELLELLGLNVSSPILIAFFKKYNLGSLPKSLTSNNAFKIINNKELNLYFSFKIEVTDNIHYPLIDIGIKNKDHKFSPYLTEIGFLYKEPPLKNLDPKNIDFWNLTPPPTASLEEIKSFFEDKAKEYPQLLFFSKKQNDDSQINFRFNKMQNKCTAIWITII